MRCRPKTGLRVRPAASRVGPASCQPVLEDWALLQLQRRYQEQVCVYHLAFVCRDVAFSTLFCLSNSVPQRRPEAHAPIEPLRGQGSGSSFVARRGQSRLTRQAPSMMMRVHALRALLSARALTLGESPAQSVPAVEGDDVDEFDF